MRVHVQPELCQGHGLCHMSAPEIFKLRDEDGHAYVEGDTCDDSLRDLAQLGADGCPELAIEID